MSDSLLWELTKKNNSFLVKRDGLQLSSDPMNVANVHAFKYSGVNKKAVGVAVKDGKVVLSTKLGKSQVSKPKTQLSSVTLKSLSHTKKGNKAAKAIIAATKGYRSDLTNLAVGRYHALARGINNNKK